MRDKKISIYKLKIFLFNIIKQRWPVYQITGRLLLK